MADYSIDEAKSALSKKRCTIQGKTIFVPPKGEDIGNGTWGKIDFLCNHHGYIWTFAK
jgi:hypothetical protein